MRQLLMVVLLTAGCTATTDPCSGVSGACITLSVESSAPVDTLRISAFGETRSSTGTGSAPIHVALVPPAGAADGTVTIHVDGAFAGSLVGSGDGVAVLAGSAHVSLSVTLSAVGADLGGGGVDLSSDASDGSNAMPCTSGQECPSMLCNQTTHMCATSVCDDGLKDSTESDIDCGGPTCGARCAADQTCSINTDCRSGVCTTGFCQKASLPAWIDGPPLPAWFTTGTLILPGRADGAYISTGGIIYVIAGWGETVSNGQEKYIGHMQYLNVAAGDTAWSEGDTFGVNDGCNGNVGSDGNLWLSGGGSLNPNIHIFSHPANMPTGSTWTQLVNGDPPIQRSNFAAPVGPEGWIYQIGGGNSITYAWDATNKLWQVGPSISVDRSGLGAVLATDKRIYVMGGSPSGASMPTNVNEQMDLVAKVVTPKRVMPVAKASFGMVGAPDGRVYVIGGTPSGNQNQGVATVEVYVPATDTWTTVASLKHPRAAGGAVIASDGRIWMIAGYSPDTGGDISPYVEIYGPDVTPAKKMASAGETIAATGTNFAANAAVTISLGGNVIGGGNSDANGMATLSLTIPAGTPAGPITLTVLDNLSEYPVTVALTVM